MYAPPPPPSDTFVSLPLLRQAGANNRVVGWEHLPRLAPASYEGPNPGYAVRTTTNGIPKTQQMLDQFKLPVAIMYQPLSKGSHVPGVPYVVRCSMCKAYVSCYSQFYEGGAKWRCHLCGVVMDTPKGYMCPVDANGVRTDIDKRPELKYTCVEYSATADYGSRPVQPPCVLFLLDVSYPAVASGMLAAAIEGIRRWAFEQQDSGTKTRYGVLTYDRTVYAYHVKPTLHVTALPEQYTDEVPVIDGIRLEARTLPVNHKTILADLETAGAHFFSMLDVIMDEASRTKVSDASLGAALTTAMQLMDSTGGKIVVFTSQGQSFGFPAQENASAFYTERGIVCNQKQISVDVFTCGPVPPADSRALYSMPRMTCGRFRSYQNPTQLTRDLPVYLAMKQAQEAILRVRHSKGIRVSVAHASCYTKTPELLVLPVVDECSALAIYFQHASTSPLTSEKVFVQITLMYTNEYGERKLRVHNVELPVVSNLAPMYTTMDVAAMGIAVSRMLTDDLVDDPNNDIYEAACKLLEGTLYTFRDKCLTVGQRAGTNGGLLLPKAMQALPHMLAALLRSPVVQPRHPCRLSVVSHVMLTSVGLASMVLCPIAYRVLAKDGTTALTQVPCSSLSILDDGACSQCVFVLDMGTTTVVVIGKDTRIEYLEKAFGTAFLESIVKMDAVPPYIDNKWVAEPGAAEGATTPEHTLLRQLTQHRVRGLLHAPVRFVVNPSTDSVAVLQPYLCEDVLPRAGSNFYGPSLLSSAAANTLSYVSLLQQLKNRQK